MPIRIEVGDPIPVSQFAEYREANLGLSLPFVEGTARSPRLAIVGSGLSLRRRFRELQDFQGEIWAINGAWGWLREHGVEATFFSVDPMPIILEHSREARDLVLATQCSPELFAWHMAQGSVVRRWHKENFGLASSHGAYFAAVEAGYRHIEFFGCECSFVPGETHVNSHKTDEQGLIIDVLGEKFYTRPTYYGQALVLAELIAPFPGLVEERSGGLLGALVKGMRNNPDLAAPIIPISQEAAQ